MFLGVSDAPIPRRRDPSDPIMLGHPTYSETVSTGATTLVLLLVSSAFLWVSHAPVPRGRGPSVPKKFYDLIHARSL